MKQIKLIFRSALFRYSLATVLTFVLKHWLLIPWLMYYINWSADMVSFTDEQKYYLYLGPMDMRKDIDSLADIVHEEMCLDPTRFNGVFIFISKKRNIMKILYRGLKRFELTKIRLDEDKFLLPVFDEERIIAGRLTERKFPAF